MKTVPGKKGCAETISVQIHFLERMEKKRNKGKLCLATKSIRQAVRGGAYTSIVGDAFY